MTQNKREDAYSCVLWDVGLTSSRLFFSWRRAAGVLLWALWEIQCHGSGAAGPESRGPLWPLRQDLFTEDGLNDCYTAGEFKPLHDDTWMSPRSTRCSLWAAEGKCQTSATKYPDLFFREVNQGTERVILHSRLTNVPVQMTIFYI